MRGLKTAVALGFTALCGCRGDFERFAVEDGEGAEPDAVGYRDGQAMAVTVDALPPGPDALGATGPDALVATGPGSSCATPKMISLDTTYSETMAGASDNYSGFCLDGTERVYAVQLGPAGSYSPRVTGASFEGRVVMTLECPPTSGTNCSPIQVGSSRVDLQACKLEYSIVSPK